MEKLKVLSLFSGIGAYERGLQNSKIEYDLINYCEIHPIKSKAYSILHNENEIKNLKDITKTDYIKDELKNKQVDLLVYSPPCQSYSKAGKQEGINDIRGTLFYKALEVIKSTNPKCCIMENVDNLPNKFQDVFNDMLECLSNSGYNNYWKIINAKDFLPQNRERVFLVSIRKDLDDGKFEFPKGENNQDWSSFLDINECRQLTGRQQKMVDLTKNNALTELKIEGKPQFEHSTIMLRQSGLRFQNNRHLPTLCAAMGKGGGNFPMIALNGQVGGLTSRQCFKLMGFEYTDSELLTFNKISISNQYLMAGDSVCVPILTGIFNNLKNTLLGEM